MNNIIVAGIGTGVGKTVAAAVLTTCLNGEYWKPIQCGSEEESDTAVIEEIVDAAKHRIHKPAYSLKSPLSPHHAARLEQISISLEAIILPNTTRPLIIEGVGGVFVPLTLKKLTFDLFKSWDASWVVVSRHYLGSINHTLLTLDALQRNHIPVAGIIFNGFPNEDTERAILEYANVPMLGRLLPENIIDSQTIQRYAHLWRSHLSQVL